MIHTTAPVICLIEIDSGRSEAELLAWSNAYNRSLLEEFGPTWNLLATTRVQTPNEILQPGEWPAYQHARPDKRDPAGALAYHDRLDDGTPVLHNFDRLAEQFGDSPSQGMDHEIKEALVDELLNEATQDDYGVFWAKEVCDPCQQVGYPKDGVMLSDFVTPEWFSPPRNATGATKYSHLGTITAPFMVLPGGYAQKFAPGRGWVQVGMQTGYRAHLASLGLGRGVRRAAIGVIS